MLPLYLAEQLVALGIASILLDTPGTAMCAYVCWRILRSRDRRRPELLGG